MKNVAPTESLSIVGNGALRTTTTATTSPQQPAEFDEEDKASLLHHHHQQQQHDEETTNEERINDIDTKDPPTSSVWNNPFDDDNDELHGILQLALPVCATYMLSLLPDVVGIILVGHVEAESDQTTKVYLDAASWGTLYFSMMGLTTVLGLGTALDTLCSQAFGANHAMQMGVYLQTSLLVLGGAFVFVVVFTWLVPQILISLGQPLEVAHLAGDFCLCLLPGIPLYYLYELLRKVLQAQNIGTPMFWIAVIANLINIGVGYLLVYHTSLGWLGAAVARSICNASLGLLLVAYIHISRIHEVFWNGWHWHEAYQGLIPFLELAIPGWLQVGFDYWCFEVLAILSGWLDSPLVTVGANYAIFSVTSLLSLNYFGIGVAGGTRIGNALGDGNAARAQRASHWTLCLNGTLSFVVGIALVLCRGWIPRIYTHDEDVVELTKSVLVVAAFYQMADAMQEAMQGIFRGCGRQFVGAVLNFVGNYIVGLPLAAVLGFATPLELHGLWLGLTIGLTIVTIVGVIVIVQSDWKALSINATTRLSSE